MVCHLLLKNKKIKKKSGAAILISSIIDLKRKNCNKGKRMALYNDTGVNLYKKI